MAEELVSIVVPSFGHASHLEAALRSGDWKLVRPARRGETAAWELYRIDRDAGEASNLASQEPAKLRELSAAWEKMNAEMAEPLWR